MRPRGALVEHVTDEAWDEVFSANLKGVVNVTRAAVPFLTSTSTSSITSRSITNIVSISALRGALLQSVYCAAQFGIVGFSKSVAMELEPRGVRVNVVCLETSMDDGVARDRAAVVERGSDALGKLGTPGEAVEVVLGLMAEGSRGVEESR
ncbi:hypothetical protein BDV95DRAFT_579602 [Massariosphaeria phaeospora]|uniref:Uncharacterized protein n=1 Tax=Massariosphaeria phaeospora TaxID=100035 RepID=A0A7C8M2R1_9PLEO|nr:hypothetical protein BDV95DRAFT_579602 [Massariosphaeria phaeospora]